MDYPKNVDLNADSSTSLEVYLTNDVDEAEDLSQATMATLTVAETPGGPALVTKTEQDGLTINADHVTLNSAADISALDDGTYIADLLLNIDGEWYRSDPWYINVCSGIGETP